MDQFGQHPAEPDADHQGAFPRFDVDVAGAGGDGIHQQEIDQNSYFDALLCGFRLQILDSLIHDAFRLENVKGLRAVCEKYFGFEGTCSVDSIKRARNAASTRVNAALQPRCLVVVSRSATSILRSKSNAPVG